MPNAPNTADMDYIVAGCHDCTVHIYHLKRHDTAGVQLEVGRSAGWGCAAWRLFGGAPACEGHVRLARPAERASPAALTRVAGRARVPRPSSPPPPQEMTCGGYDSKVTAVDFSPSGTRMASSGGDKNTVRGRGGRAWAWRGRAGQGSGWPLAPGLSLRAS